MQDTDDPDRLREIFETDTSVPFHRRFNLMSQAEKALLDAGREEEAKKARWDAALFCHWRGELDAESEGRFRTSELSGAVSPARSIFTDEALDYYEQRARETNNPVLKSWYADFIWERRHDHIFARMAIQALHDTYSDIHPRRREVARGRRFGRATPQAGPQVARP